MIIRKPYAFFIKHFRLIHFILSFLMVYCLYYSKRLLDFFNTYINQNLNLKGQELASIYVPNLYLILPILIIIVLTVILVVMILKKKPMMLYIFNIASMIFATVIIVISKMTLTTLETTLITPRTLMLTRDMVMLSFMIQVVLTVIVLVRSIGFDIKKFDFKQDLKELEIDEEDREEIEVEFNFDKNKARRELRRKIRFLKYAYKENKLFAHILIASISGLILLSGIIFVINIERPISENQYITLNGITLKIKNSYMTTTDYKGKTIDEDSVFVILKTEFKTFNNTKEVDSATLKLSVGNYSYIPSYEYKQSFIDFGTVYAGEILSKEVEEKVLVYKIPKQLKDEKISFAYVDKNTLDNKMINLNIKKLSDIKENGSAKLGETLEFKDSIISSYQLKIDGYFIQKKYKLNYNFCYLNECFDSYEYLVPSIDSNTDKAIVRLNGYIKMDEKTPKLNDLYDIINTFGSINYTVSGVDKTNQIELKKVVSTKKKEENVYYIEVPIDTMNADNISLIFKIRDKKYEYILK